MKHPISLVRFVAAGLLLATTAAGGAPFGAVPSGAAPAGAGLLEEVDAVRAPQRAFAFTAAIVAPDGDALTLSVRVKDRTKSLVRYLEPPRSAGRALLFVDRNMWVYVPGTRRILRISPRQRLLGGVASADLARMVYSLDYRIASVEEAPEEGGERRRRLTLSRTSKGAAYARIVLVVGGDEARPLQATFFASPDRHHVKTAWFEGYAEVLGRRRPTVLRVIDHLDGDRETHLEYSGFVLEETPDSWFHPAYLKRLK